MKFLIHSNGPNTSTGYGVQTRLLVERLKAAGHDPAVSCTYGQEGSHGSWRGIHCYPRGFDQRASTDVIHNHALHHFGGDDLGGWIITLIDLWVMTKNPLLADFNVAAWCPVDHFPVPSIVMDFFRKFPDAVPIAMSEYGKRELENAGLEPVYIPLSVDTKVYKPTPTIEVAGEIVTGRQMIGVPDDAYVVGMCAMNKGWSIDRKGFNEALRAFAVFWKRHQNAVLYMHTEPYGAAEGINLTELAVHAGVPEHAIVWVNQYAYPTGFTPEQMAAMYSALDVLLAPSHGEGFCVPLIEAQACGTPVIATDFSAQPELVSAGWVVGGQPEWDGAQHASLIVPSIPEIVVALEESYKCDREEMGRIGVGFAQRYDADVVFQTCWVPFLDSLEPHEPEPPAYDRSQMGEVAVIVPAMRPENLPRLVESFDATNDGSATLYIVGDRGETSLTEQTAGLPGALHLMSTRKAHTTYAEKVNLGYSKSTEPWVLLVGDDVEFKLGWLEAARKLSADYDVIGTNDSSNGVKNPDVASGRHADHFFVRRAYVDAEGACLDGEGVLAPECYRHWYTDKEIIGLAKARGVFTPCLESVVEHHHPGYDGDEAARQADPTYMMAVDCADADAKMFRSRLSLIEMQRVTRSKVR